MLRRYLYLLLSSWPRALELVYWPTVQMVLWGFTSQFLMTNSSYVARAGGVLLARRAAVGRDVPRPARRLRLVPRGDVVAQSRRISSSARLRPYEWVLSLIAMSLVRVGIGVVPAALLAIPLYHYSIFTLGLPLIAFFTLLIVMGWAIGLVIGALLLRHGLGAESLAWLAVFVLAPASAIYYPVSVLPQWLQWLAWTLPAAHVFEGMRTVMFEDRFPLDHFLAAAGARPRLSRDRHRDLPARLRSRAPARLAVADRGITRLALRLFRAAHAAPRRRSPCRCGRRAPP